MKASFDKHVCSLGDFYQFCILLKEHCFQVLISKAKRMQQIIPKEVKGPSSIIQQNYPLEANYFKPAQSFSRKFFRHWHSSNKDSPIFSYLRTWAVWRTQQTKHNFKSVKTLSNYIVHNYLEKFLKTFIFYNFLSIRSQLSLSLVYHSELHQKKKVCHSEYKV